MAPNQNQITGGRASVGGNYGRPDLEGGKFALEPGTNFQLTTGTGVSSPRHPQRCIGMPNSMQKGKSSKQLNNLNALKTPELKNTNIKNHEFRSRLVGVSHPSVGSGPMDRLTKQRSVMSGVNIT